MTWWLCLFILVSVSLDMMCFGRVSTDDSNTAIWKGTWKTLPSITSSWSVQNRIPMTKEFDNYGRSVNGHERRPGGGGGKKKRQWKRYLMPLLMAYKMKFFTLIPILVGGLLLLTASTGLAGFFFALFSAAMGLKNSGGH